jgi:hypothetical protein
MPIRIGHADHLPNLRRDEVHLRRRQAEHVHFDAPDLIYAERRSHAVRSDIHILEMIENPRDCAWVSVCNDPQMQERREILR